MTQSLITKLLTEGVAHEMFTELLLQISSGMKLEGFEFTQNYKC